VCASFRNRYISRTGVTLKAGDGSVMFGRTLEWGSFDLMWRLDVAAISTSLPS
jgi:penicillin V acylase-like amidase (Ntn superfamily)